jgi:hypothetical protein
MSLDDATMALSQLTFVWLTGLLARQLITYLNTRAQSSLTANNYCIPHARTVRLREKQKRPTMKPISVHDAPIEFAISWINWRRLPSTEHQLHSKRISSKTYPAAFTWSLRAQQTPWCRVPLQKLMLALIVSKFPVFYGTRSFITVFTTAPHYTLSSATLIEDHSYSHKIYFHVNNWTTSMSRFSKLSLTLTFAGQIWYVLYLLYVCYMPLPS